MLRRLQVYYLRTPCLEKYKSPTFLTWAWRTGRDQRFCFVTWKAAQAFQSNITTKYLLVLSNEMPKSTRENDRGSFFFSSLLFPLRVRKKRHDTSCLAQRVCSAETNEEVLLVTPFLVRVSEKDSTGILHGWGGGSKPQ